MNYICAITNKLGRIVAPIATYSDDCTVYPSRIGLIVLLRRRTAITCVISVTDINCMAKASRTPTDSAARHNDTLNRRLHQLSHINKLVGLLVVCPKSAGVSSDLSRCWRRANAN